MKSSPRPHAYPKPFTVSHTPKKDNKHKKPYPKSNSKERDKTGSTDSRTNSKTTFFLHHSRKGNNSSTNNCSETTLNSQLLRDSGSKDREARALGLTPPRKSQKLERNSSGSPRGGSGKHGGNKTRPKALDWDKIINSKEKEIKNLEEITVTMHKEIDRAVTFIERNRVLPDILHEKEDKIKILNDRLAHVIQEINQMKLYKKARSIPNIQEGLKEYRSREKHEEVKAARDYGQTRGSMEHTRSTAVGVTRQKDLINSEDYGNLSNTEAADGVTNYTNTRPKTDTINKRRAVNKGLITTSLNTGPVTNISNTVKGSKLESIDEATHVSYTKNIQHGANINSIGPKEAKEEEQKYCKSYREKGEYGRKRNPLEIMMQKLKRSLSPKQPYDLNSNKKFKMYSEDPFKKLVPNCLKPKQSKPVNKEIDHVKTNSNKKNAKASVPNENQMTDEDKIKTKKLNNKRRGTSSLSPKRELLLTQKIKMLRNGLDLHDPILLGKASTPKVDISRQMDSRKSVRKGEKDLVHDVNNMLEEYYRLAEGYKRLVGNLQKKNQKLEKKVRELSESKIKPS